MKIVRIGRESGNDRVIPDPHVTRLTHCQIIEDDYGNYKIIDSSTNGTYVNGSRIGRGSEVCLNKSDIVRIGNSTVPWQSYFVGGNDRTVVDTPFAPPYIPTPPPQKSGGFGVSALIFGIIGVALWAIVFGAIGMQEERKNRGLATAGFILGFVWLVIIIIAVAADIS